MDDGRGTIGRRPRSIQRSNPPTFSDLSEDSVFPPSPIVYHHHTEMDMSVMVIDRCSRLLITASCIDDIES